MSGDLTDRDQPDPIEPSSIRALVRRSIIPITEKNLIGQEQQSDATIPWMKRIWFLIRGYAIEDISTLHEAGIRGAIGKAEQQIAMANLQYAEADERRANAMKTNAEADLLRAKAAAIDAEAALKFALAERTSLQNENIDRQNADNTTYPKSTSSNSNIQEALDELEQAICLIKQKNGNIYMDSTHITDLFNRLGIDLEE